MKRIAYICADPGVPVFGTKGCSIHVQEMVRALVRLGNQVDLFAARTGGSVPDGLKDCPVYALPCPNEAGLVERERALLAANGTLESELADRPYDMVYERYSLWSRAAGDWAGRKNIPYVLEVNAPLIEEQERHRGLHDRQSALEVSRRVFGAARVVACVSNSIARHVESMGAAADRVHVIPNGVDPERFPANVPATIDRAGRFVVGFLGTLKPWHGLDLLLEAFALLRRRRSDAHLLIVGDGPMRDALEQQAARLGVQSYVVFSGSVAPSAVPGLLRSMDVAVACYPPMEDFYFSPLKVFEYMAAGAAVVASDIGQVRELIRDGVTGCLTPPGNVTVLADVLARLADDPVLRTRLGRAARQWVLAHHTWEAIARRMLALVDFSSDYLEESAAST